MDLPFLRRITVILTLIATLTISGIIGTTDWALAVTNLSKQPAIDVNVALGNEAGELKFIPANLQFEPGRRYNLHLSNPSGQKHYFTAKDFADGIWSQKVDAGNVEIKGAIHELELRAKSKHPSRLGLRSTPVWHLFSTVYCAGSYRSRHGWHHRSYGVATSTEKGPAPKNICN